MRHNPVDAQLWPMEKLLEREARKRTRRYLNIIFENFP